MSRHHAPRVECRRIRIGSGRVLRLCNPTFGPFLIQDAKEIIDFELLFFSDDLGVIVARLSALHTVESMNASNLARDDCRR